MNDDYIENLENTNFELIDKVRDLEYENEQLEFENQASKNTLDELKYSASELTDALHEMTYAKDNADNRISNLLYEIECLRKEKFELRIENAKLSKSFK